MKDAFPIIMWVINLIVLVSSGIVAMLIAWGVFPTASSGWWSLCLFRLLLTLAPSAEGPELGDRCEPNRPDL